VQQSEHKVGLQTTESLAGRCTQRFQKGPELVGASMRMWLVYPTLIVVSEGGPPEVGTKEAARLLGGRDGWCGAMRRADGDA
jgi:hypothetical protein